jgi:NAD(P)-dependent dehydrogenase (short-subunit alcohol dehydrogenase family)
MPYWNEKVAVITGGSGGLGKALAGTLAAAGANVVIVARDAQRLERAAADVRRASGNVLAMPADVTRQEHVERIFQQVASQFGRLDLLVNSAGRSTRGEAIDTSPQEFVDGP